MYNTFVLLADITILTMILHLNHDLQGAVLGPGEFFHGLALGGQQFFAGTVGMASVEVSYIANKYINILNICIKFQTFSFILQCNKLS